MKISLNPVFNKISGDIQGFNVTTKNKTYFRNGDPADGTLRKKMKKAPKVNATLTSTFSILAQKWNEMNQSDKTTWSLKATDLSKTGKPYQNGYNLFQSYFLNLYIKNYSSATIINDLTDSNPNNSYQYRALRFFRTNSFFTYGKGTFNSGTFSK